MKRLLPVFFLFLSAIPICTTQDPVIAPATIQSRAVTRGAPGGEEIWAELMEGNRRFVSGQTKPREVVQLRHILAGGQHPSVIILTCSDSRVPPELIFDQNLGDLFVIRAAAIRENVHQSARDVLANSEVLRHAQEESKLSVVEAIYKLDEGEVVRLGSSPANSH